MLGADLHQMFAKLFMYLIDATAGINAERREEERRRLGYEYKVHGKECEVRIDFS